MELQTLPDTEELIRLDMASWPWRIKRLGYTIGDFVTTMLNIGVTMFGEYTAGKTFPAAPRYVFIRNTIATMERAKGFDNGSPIQD